MFTTAEAAAFKVAHRQVFAMDKAGKRSALFLVSTCWRSTWCPPRRDNPHATSGHQPRRLFAYCTKTGPSHVEVSRPTSARGRRWHLRKCPRTNKEGKWQRGRRGHRLEWSIRSCRRGVHSGLQYCNEPLVKVRRPRVSKC